MSDFSRLVADLNKLASKSKASILQRFFKTAPGQYGAGDIFLGIKVPDQRKIAKKYAYLSLKELKRLLESEIHEFRLVALLILVEQYEQVTDLKTKEKIVKFYLSQRLRVNNWDLVDLSVYKILGDWLLIKTSERKILDKLAVSRNLWERRIAMVATYAFIKKGQTKETLRLAKKLLKDEHDLVHKAVGWMLREVGKRVSKKELLIFLDQNSKNMPRTALRYAIEHLSPSERENYLKK